MPVKKTWWDKLKESVAYPLTGQKDTFNLIFGFFAASDIKWEVLKEDMETKGYEVTDATGQTIKKGEMAIYPLSRFEKTFHKDKICKASIELETKSMSEAEIKAYIPHYVEKKKALEPTGKNIVAWLERKTGENAFYNFVEFTINCSLDIKKYNELNRGKPVSKRETEIEDIISRYLKWISEQEVYSDFHEAVNEPQKVSKTIAKTETTETTKEETKKGEISTFEEKALVTLTSKQKVSPFAYYLPKNDVDLEISPEKFSNDVFKLGKKLTLSAKISKPVTSTPSAPKLKLELTLKECSNSASESASATPPPTLRYRLALESDYFSFEPKISGLETGKECKVTITPNIEKITAEEKSESGYPMKFNLIDTKYDITYPEKKRKIKLGFPDFKIELERPNLPHKGWPINLTFKIAGLNVDKIPLTLRGKVGPDFSVVNPPPSDDTKKSEIEHKFKVKPSFTFTLKAQRAGHWPWFRNQAYFEFSIGKWKLPIKQKEFSVGRLKFGKLKEGYHWEMRMNVFPTWFDTLVTGFVAIYSLLLLYYPDCVPPIAAELNPSTLTLPSSIIYVAYRIINWGRTLQSESK